MKGVVNDYNQHYKKNIEPNQKVDVKAMQHGDSSSNSQATSDDSDDDAEIKKHVEETERENERMRLLREQQLKKNLEHNSYRRASHRKSLKGNLTTHVCMGWQHIAVIGLIWTASMVYLLIACSKYRNSRTLRTSQEQC